MALARGACDEEVGSANRAIAILIQDLRTVREPSPIGGQANAIVDQVPNRFVCSQACSVIGRVHRGRMFVLVGRQLRDERHTHLVAEMRYAIGETSAATEQVHDSQPAAASVDSAGSSSLYVTPPPRALRISINEWRRHLCTNGQAPDLEFMHQDAMIRTVVAAPSARPVSALQQRLDS